MEFSIPWENWVVSDIQYGLSQTNTRIENGLFVPIFYSNSEVRCQAFHVMSPPLTLHDKIESNNAGTYVSVKIPKESEFGKKLKEFDAQNVAHAALNKNSWWAGNRTTNYRSVLSSNSMGELEWRIQIPDSGIFSCFDMQRKSWFASNESGLSRSRQWRILARTSGLWVDQGAFGMEWKLIGAFVD
jgi:hypothetical protein